MVWGARNAQGVDDLCARLRANDPKLASLVILRHRKCGPEEVRLLCDALAANHTLRELSINAHTLDAASAEALASMLAANATLTTLSVGDSKFGCEGMARLAPGVGASRSLTHLDAELKGVGAEGAEALGQALGHSTSLVHLQLGSNPLGDKGVRALCAFPWPSLRTLDLSSCGMGQRGIAALGAAPSAPSLTSLSVAGNPLGCGAAAAPAPPPAQAPAAAAANDGASSSGGSPAGEGKASEASTALAAQACSTAGGEAPPLLTAEGAAAAAAAAAEAVGELLRRCTGLRVLQLGRTGLGDAGAAALAKAILHGAGPFLETLGLEHNGIGEAGGLAIADAFTCSACPISRLALEGNPGVNDAAVNVLAEALVRRCSASGQQHLDEVDLTGTGATSASLRALSAVPGLRKLSLLGCKLGDAGAAELTQCLASPTDLQQPGQAALHGFKDLQEVVVSACGISREGMEVLLQGLASSRGAALQCVEMGANPCCQADDFQQRVQVLADARPDLAVHWRTAGGDSQEGGPIDVVPPRAG